MEDNRRLMLTPMRNYSKEIELFQVYGDIIVGILKDTSFKNYEVTLQEIDHEIPFGSDIWDFFKKHERTLRIFTLRNLEIQDLGGNVEKVLLKNNQFIKYINGLRKKKIGMVRDESILDPFYKSYWDRQNLFKEIITQNILKHYQTSKGDYHFIKVEDVCKFFSDDTESESISGKELYQKFLNEYGKYDFNLTIESVGKYLKNMTRFFSKKRIHFKDGDRRMNIYNLVIQ